MTELESIIKKYSPQFKVTLRIQDTAFTVLTNSTELAKMLRSYLALWLADDIVEPGHLVYAVAGEYDIIPDRLVDIPRTQSKKSVKEAAYDIQDGRVILKKRTGVVVLQEDDIRCVIGNLTVNVNQVINVIDEVYINDYLKLGYVLLHSSAVIDRHGNGVAFTSESGAGKSTMAVALLEHGFKYLSNDRILLKAEGESVTILGVPKKPRLNPGTILVLPRLHQLLSVEEISKYSALPADELWHLEDKHDVNVDEIFGMGTTVSRGKLRSCFILDWSRDGGSLNIDRLAEADCLRSLIPMVINMDPTRKQTGLSHGVASLLNEIIKQVTIYRVSGAVDIAGLAWYTTNLKSAKVTLS